MNWEALGAVGELLGSILLLASLAYVGLQIRDAKIHIKSATSQARSDSFIDLWKMRLTPELSSAELVARTDPEKLTETHRYYLIAFLTMFLNHYQNTYYQLSVGTLEEDQTGALETLPLFKAAPYYGTLWRDGLPRDSYNDDFISYVDSIVAASST